MHLRAIAVDDFVLEFDALFEGRVITGTG
jgi:hypothetical protein